MANLPLAYNVESYTRLPIRPSSVTLQTYCSELLAPYVCGEIDSLAHFGESSMAFLIQWTEFPSQLPFSGYNWLYSRFYCLSFGALHPQTASTSLLVRICSLGTLTSNYSIYPFVKGTQIIFNFLPVQHLPLLYCFLYCIQYGWRQRFVIEGGKTFLPQEGWVPKCS